MSWWMAPVLLLLSVGLRVIIRHLCWLTAGLFVLLFAAFERSVWCALSDNLVCACGLRLVVYD